LLSLTEEARVLLFNREGATDPGAYHRILSGEDGVSTNAVP
jgi:hypothetical protein